MLFNSYVFILVFLPIVLFAWWATRGRPRLRLATLTAASYFFYGYWDWRFTALMAASTAVDFYCGLGMGRHPSARGRYLAASLVTNLGVLAVFKYLGFFGRSVNALVAALGTEPVFPELHIILPVGISFYTFQSMSYSIDVYRSKVEPTTDPLLFAAYVSMFPQLVAGPIVRFTDVEAQLANLPQRPSAPHLEAGFRLFAFGLFKKLWIADTIATWIDPQLSNPMSLDLFSGWWCALGYTAQLYFDFSAYSDMAVGLGLLLGLRLPQNFDSPYVSASISEFWRRWHITLSSWLRDYLYIPLGGNRHGRTRTLLNLTVTMFLGGLWHGANWTFVVWGLFHGLLLVVGALLPKSIVQLVPRVARVGITFLCVVLGWVIFRASDLAEAWLWLRAMSGANGAAAAFGHGRAVPLLIVMSLIGCWLVPNMWQLRAPRSRFVAVGLAFLFFACILRLGEPSPFLYFQF